MFSNVLIQYYLTHFFINFDIILIFKYLYIKLKNFLFLSKKKIIISKYSNIYFYTIFKNQDYFYEKYYFIKNEKKKAMKAFAKITKAFAFFVKQFQKKNILKIHY